MRSIKSLLTVLMLVVFTNGFSQSSGQISGIVNDVKGKPLQSTTIELLKSSDSSLIKTAIADQSGRYEFSGIAGGEYLIGFSSAGYETKYSAVFSKVNAVNYEVPTAVMQTTSGNLKEVVVTSKKQLIEVKADKTVFNVEASINATGSDAFEMLRKSPGVQVDNNDNISMKGKTGVRIYVDGKMLQLDNKDLTAYLRSINSNDMEAIEMISNPSAKYDASGNAGIINIRLKKNKKFGTNGSITSGFVQGVTPKGNGGLNLNYRDKKVNVFGNISGALGLYHNNMNLYRLQKDTIYDQINKNINKNNSINTKAGADYFINSRHTIGIMTTFNHTDADWSSASNSPIYYQQTGAFIKTLQAFNTAPSSRTNANINVNYRYSDTSGTEINFDADHGLFRGTGTSFQPNNYLDQNSQLLYNITNRNNTPINIDINTAKIDIEQRLWKGKIGYGAKFSLVKTNNTFDFFTDDLNGIPIKQLDRSNRFSYDENVNALYVNFQRALNDKFSFQAGIRSEQTNSEGILTRADGTSDAADKVKRSYFDFFPSAALSYNINEKHSFNLTYSRRIDRPTYQDLNPFENKLDELTFAKGNAFLRPQYTNTIELAHVFMGLINTTLGYSHVKDYATEITDTIKNATFIQQRNLATQQVFNAGIGASTPFKNWWNGYVNIYFNFQRLSGRIGDNQLRQDVPSYGAYLQQSFTLGKDYSAEISGWFNGPSVWGGAWRTKPQGAIDLGIQKLLFNKAASVKLSVTDIFFTAPWRAQNNFGGLSVNGGGNWESRTVSFSLNWRFGSAQIKAARERKTGLETEAKRIKG